MFFFAKSIQKAVVQPVFPPLPKLETSRGNGKTAPVAGTLYSLSGQLNRFLYKGADDFRPIVDDPALWGYSCTYFAFVGTVEKYASESFWGHFSALPSICICLSSLCQTKEREM